MGMNPRTTSDAMRSTLRSLTFCLSATFAGAAFTQNFYWSVEGSISGCYPGQTVEITVTADGVVMFQATEPVDPGTCTFGGFYPVFATYAELTVTTQCNGMVLSLGDSAAFNFFQDTAFTSVTFECGGVGNDECTNAIWITPDSVCTGTFGNLSAATQSIAPIECEGFMSGIANDVWYTFIASGNTTTVQATGDGDLDVVLEVFTDGCNPLINLDCSDSNLAGGTEEVTLPTIPGQSYLYRIYTFTPSFPTTFTFTTCVFGDSLSLDCEGAPGGAAMPGTPCDDGDPMTLGDTWSSACICTGNAQNLFTITGTVSPCNGGNIPVHIFANLSPVLDTTIYTDADCAYTFSFPTNADQLAGLVQTSCDGGTTWTGVNFAWNTLLGDAVVDLTCSYTGDCQACFAPVPSQPWQVTLANCSQAASGEVSCLWEFPDGTSYTTPYFFESTSYTFNSPGAYPFCLTVEEISGCVSTLCDTLYVDSLGNVTITSVLPDCEGEPGGNALPGNSCTVPGTTLEGTWSADCICEPNNTEPCNADFWVVQAMGPDSLPVPYELWVWNLSTGGSGNFQFLWNFGDGTSSTDAFPTHTYSGNGPYVLCLTINDNNNCTSTHCDSISINGDGVYEGMVVHADDRQDGFTINVQDGNANAVQDIVADNGIALWPNPATDELNVALVGGMKGAVTVMITDLDGRTVKTERMSLAGGRSQLRMATSGLNPGMYLLRISDGSVNLSQRFVKTD